MRVKNMTSPKTGREVPNQFVIETEENGNDLRILGYKYAEDILYSVKYFQSYDSIIVKKVYGGRLDVYLDRKYWNYSVTTSKYRNQFLGETTKETQAKIDSGEYVLCDLN